MLPYIEGFFKLFLLLSVKLAETKSPAQPRKRCVAALSITISQQFLKKPYLRDFRTDSY
jgi:hypothetical protein